MLNKWLGRSIQVALMAGILAAPVAAFARIWNEAEFENRPLIGYPMPAGDDAVIGSFTNYTIEKGDTLLDIGRWYGLSGTEISDANGRIDWWAPPAGREIILPTEHILPEGPRTGIVLNIPEMRIYYYYPPPVLGRHRGRLRRASFSGTSARVVYTFPVGLGRFDWKTPVGNWTVTAKVKDPTWVLPKDIYEEHLERDGEAEHVIPGGAPDNPLGHYKLALSLPEYGIHGTDVPWGVGMNVSHGCIRLYPEDIERLFMKTAVGTPGRFVYQPIKFGWRDNALYVEVHDDLYAVYPGLWNHALQEVKRLQLENDVDIQKLQKAVEEKRGIATYVMAGPEPGTSLAAPIVPALPPPAAAPPLVIHASAPTTIPVAAVAVAPPTANLHAVAMPANNGAPPLASEPAAETESHDSDWQSLPVRVIRGDSSVE